MLFESQEGRKDIAMKTVYFVRHGQTNFNKERRLQGWRDSELSEEGIAQAKGIAKSLLAFEIGEAIASPLGRAMQTAVYIRNALQIPITTTDDLREVSFGLWEGNTLPQLEEKWPGEWAKRQADKWNYRPPGGEANKDAVYRAQRVKEWIETHNHSKPMLVVAHFAINRIVLSLLAGIEPEDTVRMDVPHEVIYRVKKLDQGWQIGYCDLRKKMKEFEEGWIEQARPENLPTGG